MTKHILISTLVLACLGCDDGHTDTKDEAVESMDAVQATATGGMEAEAEVQTEGAASESRLVVFQTMAFARETEPGITAGFDLDNRVSRSGDRDTCGHSDFTSPEGTPGVDNQLATLVPLFDAAGIGAAESLLQSAIEDGGILFMLQVDDIDSFENDDAVSMTFRAGLGSPLLGTDGLLLAGQTFSLSPESPESEVDTAYIEDGWLYAGPFETRLPLVVFGVSYELTLHTAQIRARWVEGGGLADGVMAGAVDITEIFAIGETAAQDDPSILAAIELLVTNAGDINPDETGKCQRISASLLFDTVSAFLFTSPEVEP